MRNAVIVLLAVGGLVLLLGALSHSLILDIDSVAGTVRGVSAFWIALVVAVVFVIAGLAAAALARGGAVAEQHKLEAELQTTYERLRAAEAQIPAAAAPIPEVSEPAPEQLPVIDESTDQARGVTIDSTDQTSSVTDESTEPTPTDA